MIFSKCIREAGANSAKWLCIPAFLLTTACDSKLIQEAKKAESDGRFISNDMMLERYPNTFRPGSPRYLERDFEAGADFICDEIMLKYKRDICSDPSVNWR